ncbi:hypothetical protein [Clostridium beijerinckii]|uniref:Uncharacterized protein n=1 Tax=Clostridium beijerinckii TaxID=1520 RepID=A0AAE5H2U3_CLOBE|nr:hypothetical protein [Clostridium beijerinckii]NSB13034.1 hypothetical protein [Clostridium beijerinckii]OOM22136.1 hypothetical protein CLOBE_44750 [Clostridium beijerinckii]
MTNERKEQIAHDLALIAAKEFVESNRPEYKVSGFQKCISDLLTNYQDAYHEIMKKLD